jgi:hypothetical protein
VLFCPASFLKPFDSLKLQIMEKIITQALSASGFKNPELLTKIIFATPNPRVAAEMILGCYTPNEELLKHYRKDNSLYNVYHVDELRNIVSFERYTRKTKQVFFLTKEDKENDVYQEEKPKDWYSTKELPIEGFNTFREEDSIENFTTGYYRKERISYDSFYELLDEWSGSTMEEYVFSGKGD